MVRTLFVSILVPGGMDSGTHQRVTAQYDALLELGEIDTVLVNPGPYGARGDWKWPERYGRLLLTLPGPPIVENLGRFGRSDDSVQDRIQRATPYLSLRSIFRADAQTRQKFNELDLRLYDLIFVSRLTSLWALGLADRRRVVVDVDDLPSHAYAPHQGSGWRRVPAMVGQWRVRQTERRSCGRVYRALVCSEDDRRHVGHPNVAVLPNTYQFQAEGDEPITPGEPGGILFVGNLNYWPNYRGLKWFVERVLPQVRAARPDVRLQIVGRFKAERPAFWDGLPGVDAAVNVEDPGVYIRAAQIEICPLLAGYGTRIKILESLAFGKPVVSTTIGAYGQPMGEAEGLFRRDDPAGFAQACVELLSNEGARRSMGERGRAFVRDHLSPKVFRERLQMIVRPLEGQASARG